MSVAATTDVRGRTALVGLLAAHAASQTGNAITVLATPFYVIAQGGSGFQVGLAATFATLPVIIGGPLGGVLVDRVGYRRASIAADLASGVTVLAIAVLHSTVGLPFWGLLALLFLSGLLDTPGQTARTVLLPALATAAGYPLERAVGLITAIDRIALLIGAPVGGALVAGLGAANAFYVNAATFALSATLVILFVTRPEQVPHDPSGAPPTASRPGYWRDLADGFLFLVREPLLRLIVCVVLVTNALDAARFSVLLPLYGSERLDGAISVGLLSGALGGGAVVGSLLFGAVGHRIPRRPLFVVAFVLTGGPSSAAFALALPFPSLLVMLALTGLAAGAINPTIGTLRLQLAPPAMRARVQSLMIAGAWAAIPLGALLGGAGADYLGLTTSFAVIGVVYVAVTLTPLLGGSWKRMDSRVQPQVRCSGSFLRHRRSEASPAGSPPSQPRTPRPSEGAHPDRK